MISSASPFNAILDYQKTALSRDYKSSTKLNIRTREGDQVSLSMCQERSYSESREYVRGVDGSEMQRFSLEARAASSYSLSVQGELNEEEMSAILNLAERLSPLAKGFAGEVTGRQGEVLGAELPNAIENFRYSVDSSSTSSSSGTRLNPEMASAVEGFLHPENSNIRDLPALLKAVMDSVFMAVADKTKNAGAEILKDYVGLLPYLNSKMVEMLASAN